MTTLAYKNADEKIYPASMTKVMTVITALDYIEDLDAKYTVTKQVLNSIPSGASNASMSYVLNEYGVDTYTVRDFGFNYPNPVITPNLEIEIIDFGEMDGFYTIEMWNDKYTRVRYVSTQEDHVQINVSDLPNGWYQIVLRKDGELIDSGNVMINN
jgi:hypothetical protein